MSTVDSVLVANRGEIARRVFRTARAMGLRTVAVFTDADEGGLFVGDADEAVRVPSYLDADGIVAAARHTGAAAVHPGYGFLAENADFARAVEAAGLVWVGPPAAAIAAMGDKIEAKRIAADAAVPVLPSTDDPERFGSLGFPVLVKAAAGGGGKGMRVVDEVGALADAVASARREAQAGFGDDRVFAERFVPRARHVEIQVLADGHGRVVHLGERECSVQRRHQKVIEEAPSPFVTPELRSAMGDAAIRLATALDYRSAGTVEFLVDDDTGDFFFLEVNTRLQVEHPVTEEVTGVDLVREQLLVAMGYPLTVGPSIEPAGHAIEVRLYAEDPANDFLPATGRLDAFEPAPSPAVRWETGVAVGSEITVDYDPMIAKVVATGPSRTETTKRLALALERLHLGGVVTNRDFLVASLRHDAFLAGDTTTDFIERHTPATSRSLDDEERSWLLVAAALWAQGAHRAEATTLASMPSGFRVGRLAPERVQLGLGGVEHEVYYRARRDGSFLVGAAGADEGGARIHDWSPTGLDLEYGGRRRRVRITRVADRLHLTTAGGGVTIALVPRFAVPELEMPGGAVTAPMPGKVIELRVGVGDLVEAGQVVAVLEAMKMENHLRATRGGPVTEVRVAVGDQVEKDALVLVIDDGDDGDGTGERDG